jgi:hypothetical protein
MFGIERTNDTVIDGDRHQTLITAKENGRQANYPASKIQVRLHFLPLHIGRLSTFTMASYGNYTWQDMRH